MDTTKVSAVAGNRAGGESAVPPIFRKLLIDNAHTHTKLGQIQLLVNLESPNVTREQYLSVLKKMYGLYAVLEPKLEKAINWGEIGIDFNQRSRLVWLERDLQKFGISGESLSEIPLCSDVIELNTLSEVLGSMAVVEGSSAGATATAQKIANSNLKLGPENGAAFFNNYGEKKQEMRAAFAKVIAVQNINENEFLSGGKKAFDLFYTWLSSE